MTLYQLPEGRKVREMKTKGYWVGQDLVFQAHQILPVTWID